MFIEEKVGRKKEKERKKIDKKLVSLAVRGYKNGYITFLRMLRCAKICVGVFPRIMYDVC